MSLVSKAIAALFNGISQQPATMRLPSQCEAMVNGYPTVADGVGKRPSTQHIALLTGLTGDDFFTHFIKRDAVERYLVVIEDGALSVYDVLTGVEENVVFEVGAEWAVATAYSVGTIVQPTAYNGRLFRCTVAGTSHATTEPTWDTTLGDTTTDNTVTWEAIPHFLEVPDGKTAKETFSVVTIADYSFIVNKFVTVTDGSIPIATPTNFNLWYFPDRWNTLGDDSRFYIPTAGTDKGAKQLLTDLPLPSDVEPPSEGDYYEIVGDDTSGFSRYYVIYRSGVWVETHVRDGDRRLDESTMPHALIRESDGDFHLRQFGWVPRLVGDDNSNPVPSFVGKEITSIGYNKNRLAVSAGESVVFSCAGDFGNFFRTTVTQLLDSDRVDVTVSSAKASEINYILPAQNGLMFFSDDVQFVLNVDELLTPSTVSVDVATSYEMNPDVPPFNVGQDVYFVNVAGDYSRIREYTLGEGGQLSTDATDVTAHVPRFLPANITGLTGSSNEDLLLAISSASGHENRVYTYKFFYSAGEKVQSAWSYWQFADDDVLLDASMIDSEIYFVIARADGVYLEKMNVQSTDFPLALTFDILLDRRYLFDVGDKVYNGVHTTFTLPYPLTAEEQEDLRLVLGSGATPGRVLDATLYTFPSATTVRFNGDWTAIEVFAGLNYEFSYQFSEQFHARADGVVTNGRMQLRTFTIYFEETAYFNTVVAPYGNDPNTEEVITDGLSVFTGKTLGAAELTVGAPVFHTGTYAFQIYGNSRVATVTLTNDQPFQSRFVSAEVEYFYSNRARAI